MLFERLILNSLIYTGSAALPALFGIFILPIYSRFLDPVEFGILAIITLVTGLITLFVNSTGIQAGLTRYYIEYEKEDLQKFLGTTHIFLTILTVIGLIVSFVIIYPLTNIVFKAKIPLYPWWTIAFFSTFLGNYWLFPMAILRIQEKPKKILFLNIFLIISNYIVSIPLLFKGLKVTAILLGGLCSNLFVFLISNYYIFIKLRAKLIFVREYLKRLNAFSLPLLPYSLFSYVTTFSDRYFIDRFFTLTDLGIYNVANKISMGPKMLVGSFGNTWGPYFYNEVKIDKRKFAILFSKLIRIWAFLFTLLLLVFSIFVKEMVILLTTKKYFEVYKIIPIFTIGYLFAFFYNFSNAVITFEQKTKRLVFIGLMSGIVTVILNYFLIPIYGLSGAAIVHSISTTTTAILGFIIAQRLYKLDYKLGFLSGMLLSGLIIGFFGYRFPVGVGFVIVKLTFILIFVLISLALLRNDLKIFFERSNPLPEEVINVTTG